MNFYSALNNGDASLKEPHLTSILYYIFTETYNKDFPSFLGYFLKKNINQSIDDFESLDIETDILIEQVLSVNDSRKDCDITIFLKKRDHNLIVNIENKISINSYIDGQIKEQSNLLKHRYCNHKIFNILLLPFESNININDNSIDKIIYWYGLNTSLIQQLIDYEEFINEKDKTIKTFIDFFKSFGNILEQQINSFEKLERGPRNNYPFSMYQYLKQISDNWNKYFQEPFVTLSDLLKVFDEVVFNSINKMDISDVDKKAMMDKFRRGALEVQPKIMTINEKNRIHFGVYNGEMKALFFYPEHLDGVIHDEKWKNRKIKPLTKKETNEKPVVFWKDKETSNLISEIYNG